MNKLTLHQYFEVLRVKVALKIVLTGIICILINNIFHLNLGYFSLLFVFLIISLFHGEVLKSGTQAFVAALISGVVTLFISYLFIDSKVIYIILTSIWIFFVIAILVKHFLAMLIGGVAATMAMYTSIYDSVPQATHLYESYMTQLFIAVVVSWIIDALVWPNRSRVSMQVTLKTVYDELSELFSGYTKEDISDRKDHHSISTSLITFSNLVSYVGRMQREEGGEDFPIDLYMKIITFSRGIYIKTEVLEDLILKEHDFMKEEDVSAEINQIFSLISQSFSTIAQSIGTTKIVELEEKKLQDAVLSLHKIYKEMHEIEGREHEYYEDLYAFGAMLPVLDDISSKILKIAEAINIFHKNDYRAMLEGRVTHTKKVERKKARSFFTIDRDSARAGIRTVVIFLLLMFGEVVIGLPGGGQVVFFAILFGVIPNLGQAYMKSRYGILGVLAGLALSFLSIMVIAIAPRFLILVCLYSLVTFAAGYVASSSKDISVAGLQTGLLFPFGILLTTGPNLDISDAFTRFSALFSAVLIGLIVQHLLWPTNPYKLLKRRISKSLNICSQIISNLITTERRDREKVDNLIIPLAASLPTSTSLLHDAEYIIREDDLHAEELISIIESIELLYADLETLRRGIYEVKDSEFLHEFLVGVEASYTKLGNIFEDVSLQFDSNQEYIEEIDSLKEVIENQVHKIREEGKWRSYDPIVVENIVLINATVLSMIDSLRKMSSDIGQVNQSTIVSNAALSPKEA